MTKVSTLSRRPILLSLLPIVIVTAVGCWSLLQYCSTYCSAEEKRIENLSEAAFAIALFAGAVIWLFLIFNAFRAGISRGALALIGSVCLGFLGFYIVAITGWSQL